METEVRPKWLWIENPETFRELEGPWSKLSESINSGTHLFQTYSWCLSWIECFVERFDTGWHISILTYWDDEGLALICPLAIRSQGPFKIAYWLGEPLTQYGDVLARGDVDSIALIQDMWVQFEKAGRFDLVLFNYVRDDSKLYFPLSEIGKLIGEETAVSLRLTGYADWSSLEKWHLEQISRNSRKARRRAFKNLQEMGPINCKRLIDKDEIEAAVDEIWAEKAAWLREKGLRSSAFADPVVKVFVKVLLLAKRSDLDSIMFCLFADGKPVAHEIGFLSHGRYAQHLASFSLAHSKGAPGNYLTEFSLENFRARGVEWFDQLAPATDGKLRWGTHTNKVSAFALPISSLGSLYVSVYLQRLKPALKIVLNNLPLPAKRLAKTLQDKMQSR